ncbi:MAG: hypothetical protein ACYDAN_16235 [Candidatus Limnocylindrales bacterium]
MTEPRTPSRNPLRHPRSGYPSPTEVPQAPRRRPSEERAALAASSRTATQLALIAIVIAGLALGLTVWRTLVGTGSSCQSAVWSAEPDANRLPAQWQMRGTTFDTNRRSTTYAGPDPGDGSGAPNVLATVTCIPDGAAEALSRAAAAAREVGQAVSTKDDLSDGGFEATDANSGAIFLEFRRGDILVDMVGSQGATATDIETVASAYDRALGGDGGSISSPEPASSANPSASADTSSLPHDAPELEKLLPTKVGSLQLTTASQLGSAALSEGEPAAVALAADGKQPDDLHMAQAAADDASGNPVLGVTAVSVTGLDAAKVRLLTMDYFGMTGSAVKQSTVTLAGKPWTKFDLGDGGMLYYVRAQGDVVLVITTADAALAEQAAAAIP